MTTNSLNLPSRLQLMALIQLQTEVAKLGMAVDRVLDLVTDKSMVLTGAMMIDMNGLKQINDQFGHRYGDAAIKDFASRLKKNSHETDTVARFGGDGFGIACR